MRINYVRRPTKFLQTKFDGLGAVTGAGTTSINLTVPQGKRFKGTYTVLMNLGFAAIQTMDLRFFVDETAGMAIRDGRRWTVFATGIWDHCQKLEVDLPPGTYTFYAAFNATAAWQGGGSAASSVTGTLE